MRLKIYQAPTIGAAMAKVRAELGAEALILATRPVSDGIEVTAALDDAPSINTPLPDPAREAALRWHGVPAALCTDLATGDLGRAITTRFLFATLPVARGAAPLLLTGPPGAGKTLSIARIATRLVLSGERPLVITADGKRAGAAEQLAAFTRLLGLTLIAADEPLSLARALARRQDGAPVLIDTPGLNAADPGDRNILRDLVAACSGASALVLPSGLDPTEAAEIAEGFKGLGATMLIATRLDQSRRLGGIVAAAATGLAFAEAGIGPGAADGLCALTPSFLTSRLSPAPALADTPPVQPDAPEPVRTYLPFPRPRDGHQRRLP
ncbi:MAG: AAA family ATPase [Acetobacteraceae bacterium]